VYHQSEVEPLPSFVHDAQPGPSVVPTQTPSTEAPDSHETCPVMNRLPDVVVAGGVPVGAGGGGVEGAADGGAPKVPLSVVGAGSVGAPGPVDLADEGTGTGTADPDGEPPPGCTGALPGAVEFPALGVPGRAGRLPEGEAEGLAVDWRERALRFAGPDAFAVLPDAIAPMATAAPAEITTAATTAIT
jgi:hypothetical protein